ncbi:MAG: MinD/ParA family protein [Candidatus Aquicultor sp.]|nr:MinD/ParA family protein [Candidatus Aquicultor sp.]
MNDQAQKLRELAQRIRDERDRANLIVDPSSSHPETIAKPETKRDIEKSRLLRRDPNDKSTAKHERATKRIASAGDVQAYRDATKGRLAASPAQEQMAVETPRILSEPAVRASAAREPVPTPTRIIAVSSGKGGVGKSNLVANLGIALAMRGRKVVILDADLGMANIDVLFGINPKYNLQHLVDGTKSINDILVDGPESIKIVPGGSGIPELANLSDENQQKLIENFVDLDEEADITLIDTGAGISKDIIAFILAARETLIITTPEPTAITDAYGLIKVLTQRDIDVDVKLVVNMVSSEKEGREIADRITMACKQFLNKHIDTIGFIITDPSVNMSVRKQKPLLTLYPSSRASKCIKEIAAKIDVPEDYGLSTGGETGLRGFLSRLLER